MMKKAVWIGVAFLSLSGTAFASEELRLPQPSLDRPCLPVSSDGISRFLPSEVENADFCAPRGIAIKSVTMSDTGVWVTSQPWRTDVQGPHLPDRLAFLRVNEHPHGISMSVETAEDVYQINIFAEPSAGAASSKSGTTSGARF